MRNKSRRLQIRIFKRINAARIIQRKFRNTTTCMICLQLVQKKHKYCHTFHNKCIMKWVCMGNTTCPACRITITLSLKQKQNYFLDSLSILYKLKDSIEILNPNYFDNELTERWDRKILLCEYYIYIIGKQMENNYISLSKICKNNYNKIGLVMENTNNMINQLTEYLKELAEINENIISE